MSIYEDNQFEAREEHMSDIHEDSQYETMKVEHASAMDDGRLQLTFENGLGTFITPDEGTRTPVPGDTLRLYLTGKTLLGSSIRGAAFERPEGLEVLFYVSRQEHAAKARREAEAREEKRRHEEKRRQEFEAVEAELRAKISALPPVFQDRIERFEAFGGKKWAIQCLAYEIFVCEQAVKLADAHPDVLRREDIATFWEMIDLLTADGYSNEEHSGNTLGAAVHLGRLYLQSAEQVPYGHAALCPLLGCKDAACFAARKEISGEQLPRPTEVGP